MARPLFSLALVALFSCQLLPAERHALLVGVSRYKPRPGVTDLEGPEKDVTSLAKLLVDKWGFQPNRIVSLLNQGATRAGILAALDALTARVQPGDTVFFYFSGHGTSRYAPGMARTGIDIDTGAIVTTDLQLVIGNRDLRPRLARLDAVASVFAVFDSCYSGNSIKSLTDGPLRYLPAEVLDAGAIASYDQQFSNFGQFTQQSAAYPYRALVYLSAASKSEPAMDISSEFMRRRGVRTWDNQPHGALTNALLYALSGAADSDHDGRIAYQELHGYIRSAVTAQFPHTPQLLSPPGPTAGSSPVLGYSPAQLSSDPAPVTRTISIELRNVTADLQARISSLPGITISSSAAGLVLQQTSSGYDLFHGSGTLIASFTPAERASLLARIGAEPRLQQLMTIRYARQDFNVRLRHKDAAQGFYTVGQELHLVAEADAECWPVLVNIDSIGKVTVLYPEQDRSPSAARPGTRLDLGAGGVVTPPTGTEYLKLFAVRTKPPGWEQFFARTAGQTFAPDSAQFDQFLALVSPDVPGRSQDQLKLVTSPR